MHINDGLFLFVTWNKRYFLEKFGEYVKIYQPITVRVMKTKLIRR